MKKKLTLLTLLFGLILYGKLQAQQDPMYTKYMFNSQIFNPAYAGSKDYLSANILYREQWWGLTQSDADGKSFKYSPTTQTFALQSPIGNRVSLGLSAINDKVGITSSTTINAVYAYHFPFAKGELSIGLQGGLMNWRADWSRLTYKDPRARDLVYSGEEATRLVPNVGVGLYYFTEKFYAGFSVPHIIESELRELDQSEFNKGKNIAKLYRHYYFMTGAAIELSGKSLIFKPSLLIKNVGLLADFSANQQALNQIGAPTEFDIDLSLLFQETFWIGVSYRSAFEIAAFNGESSNDSADIWISFFLKNGIRIGAAYDFTLTNIRNYTNGSFELMLGYDFDYNVRRVNTPRYF